MGGSTQTYDGQMSSVFPGPLGGPADQPVQHTPGGTRPLPAPYDVIRGRLPKRLVTANHTTPGGESWRVKIIYSVN